MSIEESAIAARQSSSLRHSRSEVRTATDTLQALALCGDSILIEFQAAAGESGVKVVREFQDRVYGKAVRLTNGAYRAMGIAMQVVRELMLDKCPVCQGRGYIPASADGENEREHSCLACNSTGKIAQDDGQRALMAGADRYTNDLARVYAETIEWVNLRQSRALFECKRLLRP